MLVLVVGSTSAIGRAVADELRGAGAQVLTAGRRHGDVHLDLADDHPGPLVDADGRRIRCDVVVNAAAAVGAAADGDDGRQVNAVGAGTVVRLAAEAGARQVVQLSTVYAACPERAPGTSGYARTKAAGEQLAADAAAGCGVLLSTLRLTHVYDADGVCRPNQELPYAFADRAAAGEPIEVHGDGSTARDFLFLGDATRAVRKVVESEVAGTWTVASPAMPTLLEVAEAATAAFGSTATVRLRPDLPTPVGLPPLDGLGGPSAWQALGDAPEVTIEAGFDRLRAARRP